MGIKSRICSHGEINNFDRVTSLESVSPSYKQNCSRRRSNIFNYFSEKKKTWHFMWNVESSARNVNISIEN